MSILYDDAQQQIAIEAGRLLEARYSGERLKKLLETKGSYDTDFWSLCGEQGWTAITLPEENGGLGLSLVELGLIAEACGAVACGAPFLTTSYGASEAILRFGDDAVRAQWLPGFAAGETIGAIAFAENQATLPFAPAVRLAGGRLSGVKQAVPGGGAADAAIVLATGENGPMLAVVRLAQGGVTRTLLDTFDNSRCTADLRFDGAEATPLTGAADALAAAREILQRQAVVTAHEQVGGARKMLALARDYSLTRRAFGQPIGAFQSVKHRIAEDYVLVELANANAIHAAVAADTAERVQIAAAARLSATEAYDTVTRDSIQVHGGIGVTWEADLHLHQRRARTLAIEQGNMIFWEDELVNELEKAA